MHACLLVLGGRAARRLLDSRLTVVVANCAAHGGELSWLGVVNRQVLHVGRRWLLHSDSSVRDDLTLPSDLLDSAGDHAGRGNFLGCLKLTCTWTTAAVDLLVRVQLLREQHRLLKPVRVALFGDCLGSLVVVLVVAV